MPLKYLAGRPEAVRVVGAAHGGLFVIYIVLVLVDARRDAWPGAAGRRGHGRCVPAVWPVLRLTPGYAANSIETLDEFELADAKARC
jgi:integral membrane protein